MDSLYPPIPAYRPAEEDPRGREEYEVEMIHLSVLARPGPDTWACSRCRTIPLLCSWCADAALNSIAVGPHGDVLYLCDIHAAPFEIALGADKSRPPAILWYPAIALYIPNLGCDHCRPGRN